MGIFKKSDYVYIIIQDRVLDNEGEKKLKSEIFDYIDRSKGGLFSSRKIKSLDYYTSDLNVFSFFFTFLPKERKEYQPLMYELFAFAKTADDRIFKDYKYKSKKFSNDELEILVYRIKI